MLRLNSGRAVLVAEVPQTASHLIDETSGEPVHNDVTTVVYRFIIPVKMNTAQP
jgi:hypothetical protein